jgi:gas vesicle protein
MALGEVKMSKDDAEYVLIEREGGSSFGSFLWGAALGAGLALLLAPRSGQDTRNEIRDGVKRLRDRAEDAVRSAQDGVTGRIDNVRSEVKGRVDAARDAFEAGRRAARETRQEYEYRTRPARRGPSAGAPLATEEETGA